MGESRNAYRVLIGKAKGKRPLGRPRRRWEDNIKMDLREVGYDNREWINLAQEGDGECLWNDRGKREYPEKTLCNVCFVHHKFHYDLAGDQTRDLWMEGQRASTVATDAATPMIKRDEVTGEWRKLHNTELHALYSSPDIIRNIKSRRLRWAGHVARVGESRNAYRVLVGRPEGKISLGRHICAEHYDKIIDVIDALDSTDSSAVAAVKSLPFEQLLEDILFIDSSFKIVSKSIILLESSKLQLSEALNIVFKVSQTVIQNNNSLISEKVK
ncbi:hypothetical protein ANN_16256 [Periplaneta americana]|uniref:Uncharacterized protein n=1 Tax=Periplaneta americana TaxID=6978 RepID=A0ABQ8SJN9_PERAM|nr:hypothetical protein ANN_16256 [Periplaneta americana]